MRGARSRGFPTASAEGAGPDLPDRGAVRYPRAYPRAVPPLTEELTGRYREALGLADLPRGTILQIHHFMTDLVHAAAEMLASERRPAMQGHDVCPSRPKSRPSPSSSRPRPRAP